MIAGTLATWTSGSPFGLAAFSLPCHKAISTRDAVCRYRGRQLGPPPLRTTRPSAPLAHAVRSTPARCVDRTDHSGAWHVAWRTLRNLEHRLVERRRATLPEGRSRRRPHTQALLQSASTLPPRSQPPSTGCHVLSPRFQVEPPHTQVFIQAIEARMHSLPCLMGGGNYDAVDTIDVQAPMLCGWQHDSAEDTFLKKLETIQLHCFAMLCFPK